MAEWFHEHVLMLGIFCSLIGSMMTIFAAFTTSVGWGIGTLILPVVQPFFLLSHLRRSWPAAIILFAGWGMVGYGIHNLGTTNPGGLGWVQAFSDMALKMERRIPPDGTANLTGNGSAEQPFDAAKLMQGVDAGDAEAVMARISEYVDQGSRPRETAAEAEDRRLRRERQALYEQRRASRQQAASLMEAVMAGSEKEVGRLLKEGVRPDWKNGLGETPLMTAAALGYTSIVKELLKYGPDTTLRSAAGQTALDIARQNYRTEIVRMLEEAGQTGTSSR